MEEFMLLQTLRWMRHHLTKSPNCRTSYTSYQEKVAGDETWSSRRNSGGRRLVLKALPIRNLGMYFTEVKDVNNVQSLQSISMKSIPDCWRSLEPSCRFVVGKPWLSTAIQMLVEYNGAKEKYKEKITGWKEIHLAKKKDYVLN